MQGTKEEEPKTQINFYKILFNKHDKYPIGHYSRNLVSKIKDKEEQLTNYRGKNNDFFNPISDDHIKKIQKIYTKFQTIKSATKYNSSLYKKKEKIFSRPISQNTTIIGLSKNNSSPFLINSPKTRPMSQFNQNSAILNDNFFSNNYSKITKYTNNMKINFIKEKPKILKNKNQIKRSTSALLLIQKKIY